jgi:hypothetical protein
MAGLDYTRQYKLQVDFVNDISARYKDVIVTKDNFDTEFPKIIKEHRL